MNNSYALITGASGSIGKAICLQIAEDLEYNILIHYHKNESSAKALQQRIQNLGKHAELIQFDVNDADNVMTAFESFRNQHKEAIIEVLVNNAGITKDGLFMWMAKEDWSKVIDTSVNGFYHVTQQVVQPMLLNNYGRIINLVSVSGLKGNPGQTNYSAAKGALIAATKSLAQEIGKKQVTVNAVAPGFIISEMTEHLDEKELKKIIPMQRFGKPEEVAHVVSFLASEKSGYITGEVINVNGGIY